jgi:hypothetical protein
VDDSGSLRTPDRLPKLSGSHVKQSELFKTMIGARGPYNWGGSATVGDHILKIRILNLYNAFYLDKP